MKLAFILGTRPEIIKLSPLIKECNKRKIKYFVIHTNQHYSYKLDAIFFRDLDLSKPEYNLNVGSSPHGKQTGEMLKKIEDVLVKEKPSFVIVEGDTNTVLAGALAASKLCFPVVHVEAGLRSYDRKMPEEVNRILADHCSDILFAPTWLQKKILKLEGINKKVFIVGNTIVDVVKNNFFVAKRKSKVIDELKLKPKQYFLLTIHRQENVDYKKRIEDIFSGVSAVAKKSNLLVVYPIHPRTSKMLKRFNIMVPKNIRLIEPVGYFDFLVLEKNASLIFTDSGGVQEEACILKVPCITLRDNTERPETVFVGANIVSGTDPKFIIKNANIFLKEKRKWDNPFGDGHSAKKIIDIILKNK